MGCRLCDYLKTTKGSYCGTNDFYCNYYRKYIETDSCKPSEDLKGCEINQNNNFEAREVR